MEAELSGFMGISAQEGAQPDGLVPKASQMLDHMEIKRDPSTLPIQQSAGEIRIPKKLEAADG